MKNGLTAKVASSVKAKASLRRDLVLCLRGT